MGVFCFELSKLFVNSGATDIVLVTLSSTAVERASAQVAGQWRGDTALTLPALFWRRSTVSPVFFGRFPRSRLSLSRPLPTLSPSLIGHLASVDVKQHESKPALDPACQLKTLHQPKPSWKMKVSVECMIDTYTVTYSRRSHLGFPRSAFCSRLVDSSMRMMAHVWPLVWH